MNLEHLVQGLLGAAVTALGWFLRTLFRKVEDLEACVAEQRTHVAEAYITRNDYREDIRELKADTKAVLAIVTQHIQQEAATMEAILNAIRKGT